MTENDIHKCLASAKVGYDYFKITFHTGVELIVFLTRDQRAYIKTTSRDLNLWKDIAIIERTSYRPTVTEDFLFKWIRNLTV